MAFGVARTARKAGRRYNVPPNVLLGLIDVESAGNPLAVSSANAQGLTQFIPSTAKAYGVKYGDSPGAQRSQIFGAADYLNDLGFSDDPRQALGNYFGDPTSDYASRVLAAAQQQGGSSIASPASGPKGGGDVRALEAIAKLGTGQSERIQQGNQFLLDIAQSKQPSKGGGAKPQRQAQPAPGASGGWGGSEGAVMGLIPAGVTVGSTKRDTKLTASGGVSDHWKGNRKAFAADLPAKGKQGDRIARQIAASLGEPGWTGGILTKVIDGIRYQLIWNTSDHKDHVHIGGSAA